MFGVINMGVNNVIVFEFDFMYMICDYFGVELIFGMLWY